MNFRILTTLCLLSLAACGTEGVAGDECEVEADCGDDLHCHVEDGEDHGHCEADDEM